MVEIRNQYQPDTVSPPGATLQDALQERSMSQAELASRTGRPKKTVNEIIRGKTAITPDTAVELEQVLGIPARFWLAREQNYREHLARQADRIRLEPHTDPMCRRSWAPKLICIFCRLALAYKLYRAYNSFMAAANTPAPGIFTPCRWGEGGGSGFRTEKPRS